jgi:hypothetical protein
MGFYTESAIIDDSVVLENKELYQTEYGIDEIMVECVDFDHEVFQDLIRSDFREQQLLSEGAEPEVIEESIKETLKNAYDKVVEFIKKWYAKIKTWLNDFVQKIISKFVADNKKVYEKYKDAVAKNEKAGEAKVKFPKNVAFEGIKKDFVNENILKGLNGDSKVEALSVSKLVEEVTGGIEETEFAKVKNSVESLLVNGNSLQSLHKNMLKNVKDTADRLQKWFKDKSKDDKEFAKAKGAVNTTLRNYTTQTKANLEALKIYLKCARGAWSKAANHK